MEVAVSSETPLYIYQFTRGHIPEDSSPYEYRCENLKYRSFLFVWTNLVWKTRCSYEWFPVSEFYVPTFRNTPSTFMGGLNTTYEDGTECSETSTQNSDVGESHKGKNTAFRTQR